MCRIDGFLQNSWTQFIYVRCQNTNRNSHSSTLTPPNPKKAKVANKHYYASVNSEDDDVAHERNVQLLKQHINKGNTKGGAVISLIERTFANRRQWILGNVLPINEILEIYPHLSKSVCVSEVIINAYYYV